MQVGRAPQKDIEAVSGVLLAHRGIGLCPVCRLLSLQRFHHSCYSVIEFLENFFLRHLTRLGKFSIPVPNIARFPNFRSDVVVQVPSQVEYQMTKAISEGERLLPELNFAELCRHLVDECG